MSQLMKIPEFNQVIQELIGKETPHNYLLNFHLHRIYAQDYISEIELRLKFFNELSDKTPLCESHRIDFVEEKFYESWPFVYRIDNWRTITLEGKILSMEDPKKEEEFCAYCSKKAELVLIKTENPKDPRLTKHFDNQNHPDLNTQIELKKLYDYEVNGNIFTQYPKRKNGKEILILSHGMGKDSMTEFVLNWHKYDLIIFADTGNEQPETIEYLQEILGKMPVEARARFIILRSNHLGTIYDYYFERKLIPIPYSNRQCTDKFKIRPIRHFLRGRKNDTYGGLFSHDTNFKMAICINASESSRMRGEPENAPSGVNYITLFYPLIIQNIVRNEESKIILAHGYNVPIKSGCIICPFTTAKGFRRLKKLHPEEHKRVIALKNNSTARLNILNLDESESLDDYFDEENKKTVENRCSCFNGVMTTDEDEPEIMEKKNKW